MESTGPRDRDRTASVACAASVGEDVTGANANRLVGCERDRLVVRAEEGGDFDALLMKLSDKFEKVENKPVVIGYGVGALVAFFFVEWLIHLPILDFVSRPLARGAPVSPFQCSARRSAATPQRQCARPSNCPTFHPCGPDVALSIEHPPSGVPRRHLCGSTPDSSCQSRALFFSVVAMEMSHKAGKLPASLSQLNAEICGAVLLQHSRASSRPSNRQSNGQAWQRTARLPAARSGEMRCLVRRPWKRRHYHQHHLVED
ncbi:unnamed protein product [Ostreobium quekettii]|uniref:Uncharacterized protein n=1 Tax=Ostreobium quekettii TaxID=121088 RepID=A0A8S1IMN9_9CHLO|nr:unnamed protein product [Ostreobium quekettii]